MLISDQNNIIEACAKIAEAWPDYHKQCSAAEGEFDPAEAATVFATASVIARKIRELKPDQSKCSHVNREGVGSAGSDGSSSFTGRCLDCGKDLSYKIEGRLADPMLQLQPRN